MRRFDGSCRFSAFGVAAFSEFLPELALRVFTTAFERTHDFFSKRWILGDGFANEDAGKSEAACVSGVGAAVNARFKDCFGRELVAHRCRYQRVRMERGEVT